MSASNRLRTSRLRGVASATTLALAAVLAACGGDPNQRDGSTDGNSGGRAETSVRDVVTADEPEPEDVVVEDVVAPPDEAPIEDVVAPPDEQPDVVAPPDAPDDVLDAGGAGPEAAVEAGPEPDAGPIEAGPAPDVVVSFDADPEPDASAAPDAAPDAPREASAEAAVEAGADATPEAALVDAGPMCPAPRTLCTSATGTQTCEDLTSDAQHCGMCGRACPMGQACVMGACACPAGQVLCGGVCVSTDSDRAHCGMCSNACEAMQVCAMGRCTLNCPTGRTACGSGASAACVDTQTDESNCGACGTRCGAGQSCVMGMCTCPAGQTLCAGACVNVTSDTSHCGACGNRCVAGMNASLTACLSSRCVQTCNPGFGNCDRNDANGCEQALNSTAHCGGCNIQCGSGEGCFGGFCRRPCVSGESACVVGAMAYCSYLDERTNCGACGRVCGANQVCQSNDGPPYGCVTCPPGEIPCNSDGYEYCSYMGSCFGD